jgi:hypothetical protein
MLEGPASREIRAVGYFRGKIMLLHIFTLLFYRVVLRLSDFLGVWRGVALTCVKLLIG